MHTNSIWKRKIGVVIEATYNPRGLIISESRVFCSCANPLGRIFEIAETFASYIQFLRNKKAQLHFVAVLFLLCKLRTGRLVCIAKIGGVGKVPLRLSKCMLVSAVAYMRLTPFMRISANCRDLYASNPWGDRLWIAEVLICAQPPCMLAFANCRDLYAPNPWGDCLWIAQGLSICAQPLLLGNYDFLAYH